MRLRDHAPPCFAVILSTAKDLLFPLLQRGHAGATARIFADARDDRLRYADDRVLIGRVGQTRGLSSGKVFQLPKGSAIDPATNASPREPFIHTAHSTLLLAGTLVAACALLVSLPLWLAGPSCGHDFDFHLQSWLAANRAWKGLLTGQQGLSGLHWVPGANYGAGEPRLVFYPPLSWTLGSVLGALVPWTYVPQVFTFLALTGCGLSFFLLARRWVSQSIAAAAACLYLANPYLLFVAYERTAYGELLGAVTMPLVVLYSLRRRPAMVPLALAVTVLWLTNAPAAVMGSYLLVLCGVAAGAATRSLVPVARSLGALVLGTGAAAAYVLPAWYEQRWVEIARAVGPGMRVEDSFLFGHTGEPFHDQVLHTASWIAVTVLGFGLLAGAAGLLGIGSAARKKRGDIATLGKLHAGVAAALAAVALLLLPISEPVWRLAPELRFLQFPWRWMLVGSLAATLSLALAAESLRGMGRAARRLWQATATPYSLSVLLLAGCWYAGHFAALHYAQVCDEEDNVRAQQALVASPNPAGPPRNAPSDSGGFEGTDEYTPRGADNGEVQQGLPPVRLLATPDGDEGDDSVTSNPDWKADPARQAGGSVELEAWGAERMSLTIHATSPCYAVLRLMDYPAWRVLVNRRLLATRPHREDGLLTVPVAAGTTHIEVRYGGTPDVSAGWALSLVSLGALGVSAARRRKVVAGAPAEPRRERSPLV